MVSLLTWLWHGTLVTAAVAVGLRAWGARIGPSTRYGLWWVVTGVVLALPLLESFLADPHSISSHASNSSSAQVVGEMDQSWTSLLRAMPVIHVAEPPAWALVLLGGALCGYALLRVSRLVWAWRWLARAKRTARPLASPIRAALAGRYAQPRHRHAELVESPHVRVAAVLGLGRPQIALAPLAHAQLSTEDLVRIVAHEQAHVDRRDDLALFTQAAIMAVVGWHPALAWIDRRLSAEREWACDDMAVGATGDARAYARCLVRVAAWSARTTGDALALGVAPSPRGVAARVNRLLVHEHDRTGIRRWVSPRVDRALAVVATCGVTLIGVLLPRPFFQARPPLETVAVSATAFHAQVVAVTKTLQVPAGQTSARPASRPASTDDTPADRLDRTSTAWAVMSADHASHLAPKMPQRAGGGVPQRPTGTAVDDATAALSSFLSSVRPAEAEGRVDQVLRLASSASEPRLEGSLAERERLEPLTLIDSIPAAAKRANALALPAHAIVADGQTELSGQSGSSAGPIVSADLAAETSPAVDGLADDARPKRHRAWWKSFGVAGQFVAKGSAESAQRTAQAVARAGRAVGAAFAGPGAIAPVQGRRVDRASLTTPGLRE